MPDDTDHIISDPLAEHYDFLMRHYYAPYQRVDIDVTDEDLARLYARVEATWLAFGETEPHWSVITSDKFRPGTLDEQMEEFLAMGRENVDRVAAVMARQGMNFDTVKTVIDFGCGVGRVSAAYAGRGCQVTGVDVSAAHLREAEAYFDKAGLTGANFVKLNTIPEIEALPQVDLVYSLIVLQHNPPPLIAKLLRALLGRVRQGGVTYFQVPTYRDGYEYNLQADLNSAEGEMEMHVLPQAAVFQILKEEGFSLLEVTEDASCWDPVFRSQVIFAQKAPHPPKVMHPASAATPTDPPRKSWLSRLNARRKAARGKTRAD